MCGYSNRFWYLILAEDQVLGDLRISLMEFRDMTFNEIRSNQSLTLLCSDGELTKSVVTFGAVMGDNSTMIHIGGHDTWQNISKVQ